SLLQLDKMPQSKKKENSESPETAITAVTSTAASEIRPEGSEFVLPRFDFERHNPFAPKASFSSAEIIDQMLKDEATMTEEEYYKKYPYYKNDPTIKGVSADVAMEFLMERFGSI
ncbi:unnamed protein product, partial [Clonostachys solani]